MAAIVLKPPLSVTLLAQLLPHPSRVGCAACADLYAVTEGVLPGLARCC